jgi:hypothetical protein
MYKIALNSLKLHSIRKKKLYLLSHRKRKHDRTKNNGRLLVHSELNEKQKKQYLQLMNILP